MNSMNEQVFPVSRDNLLQIMQSVKIPLCIISFLHSLTLILSLCCISSQLSRSLLNYHLNTCNISWLSSLKKQGSFIIQLQMQLDSPNNDFFLARSHALRIISNLFKSALNVIFLNAWLVTQYRTINFMIIIFNITHLVSFTVLLWQDATMHQGKPMY